MPLVHKRSAPDSLLASHMFEHYVVSYVFIGKIIAIVYFKCINSLSGDNNL